VLRVDQLVGFALGVETRWVDDDVRKRGGHGVLVQVGRTTLTSPYDIRWGCQILLSVCFGLCDIGTRSSWPASRADWASSK
jgi:hypothetical protein